MTTVDNLNGLELLSGRLVTLFLTLAEAEEAVKGFPAGTHIKVTNDPNPDLNGEYTWDGEKLLKTTNNTLEKAKEQAEEVAQEIIDRNVTASHVLDLLEGQITGSLLDRRLEQRIEKIPSIVGEIEELKTEVNTINYDLGVKVNYINFDLEKLTQYVEELELIVDVDFSEIKQQIQDLHDQVNSDFEAVRVKIDELQKQVTADFEKVRQEVKDLQAQVDADIKKLQKEVADKFLEVDQIKIGLDKEIQDRIEAVRAETEARVEGIRLLNDGLTKEIQERKDGDQKLLTNIENYKTSNDKALANVREQVTVAVDTANASAQKVEALDARVVSAENNSKTALENSASAVTKVNALASDVGAMSEKVDTLEANVIKAVDDSGKALTNSATAISQSKTAVDKANAVSEQVNVVEAKLNDKSTTYRTNTAPTKATHPNLTVGDIWINQDKKNEQKRWDGKAWVDINDVRVSDNATAISKTNATVTEQGKTIQANVQKIDSLTASLGDKADASALTKLESTVTKQGTDIQTNSSNITTLQGQIKDKADAKALNELSTKVTEQGDTIVSQGESITALNNQIKDKADASAVTQLTSTVTKQGETITAQGKQITTLEGKVDGKADASALNELKATVTEHDGKIASQGQAITNLNNQIKDKADAKALTALETKVTQQGDEITSQGKQITSVEAKVDNISVGSVNILRNSEWVDLVSGVPRKWIVGIGSALAGSTITFTDGVAKYSFQNAKGVTDISLKQSVNIEEISLSKQFVGSVDVKSLTNPVTLRFGLQASYTDGTYTSKHVAIEDVKVGRNSALIDFELNPNKTVSYIQYWNTVMPKKVGDSADIYMTKPQLEAGNIATSWSTSPLDVEDKVSANSQALSTLDAKVVKQGETITSQGQALTGLKQEIDGKASVQAVDELKSTVTQQGKDITAHGQSLTSLQNQMKDKADAKALTALETKVTKQGDEIKSQGEAITSVEAHLDGMIIGGSNLIRSSDLESGYAKVYEPNVFSFLATPKARTPVAKAVTGSGTFVGVRTQKNISLKAGQEYTLSFRGASSLGKFNYAYLMYDTTGVSNTPLNIASKVVSKVETVLTYVSVSFKSSIDIDTAHIMFTCNGVKATDWVVVAEPMLVEGNTGTTWSKSIDELAGSEALNELKATVGKQGDTINAQGQAITGLKQEVDGKASSQAVNELKSTVTQQGKDIATQGQAITTLNNQIKDKADAKALTALETKVTENSGKIESQGTALTGVKATLGAMDSDSLTLDYNMSEPTAWESYYGYDVKQYFKTTTSGKIGNSVFRKDSTNPVNCFNFSKSKVPNTRAYKVSFWVRRSSDSNGSLLITGKFVKPDGSWTTTDYSSASVKSPVPLDGNWHFVEQDVDFTEFFDSRKAVQIQFGFALNHTGNKGWAEIQAYKVVPVIGLGDSDSSIASAESVSKLSATVTQQGNTITSQGTAITGLENSIKDKADAKAVNELKTTVEQQGNDIKSQGLAITKVDAKIDASGVATNNLLMKSNVMAEYNGVSYPHCRYAMTEDWEVGEVYTLLWCAEHQRGAGDTNSYLAAYAGGGGQQVQSVTNTDGKKVSKVTFTKGTSGVNKEVNFYVINKPTADKKTVATVYWAVLVKGRQIFTDSWLPSSFELMPEVTANSSAITSLDAETKRIDNLVVAQGKQVTQLRVDVDKKADGTALTALETKVTQQGKDITSQGQAITNLNNQIKDKADASAVNQLKTTVEQQGNTISSQGTAITKIDARVTDVQNAGGENLVWNGNASYDGARFWNYNTTVSGQTLVNYTSLGTSIRFIKYMSPASSTQFRGIAQSVGVSRGLKRNATYTISFKACRSSSAIANLALIVHRNVVGGGNEQVSTSFGELVQDTNNPKSYSFTFNTNTSKEITHLNLIFWFAGGTSTTAPVDMLITDVQLEEGSVATGYKNSTQPIQEDGTANATAVTALTADVKKVDDRVTSNTQAVTSLNSSLDAVKKDLNTKADAKALSDLSTTVTKQGNEITAQGRAITSVQSSVDDVGKLAQLIPNSKMVYNDPQFASGVNGLVPYDNASTGRVKVERIPRYTADNPTTSTHQVNITVSAGANPNYGGFFQRIDARANAVFVIKYLIKLPVGYSLDKAGNAIGTGGTDKFVGSVEGTGKYETYTRIISCGVGGSFSNTGHVHIRGTALTGTQTMTFPIAQIETYDVTDYQEATQGVLDALSANSTAIGKLETRTTAVEGKTNTQATQITGLQSQVNGKADSSALNSLKTTVEQQGNTITSQGTAITQVESKVSGGAGGRNFIKNSDKVLQNTGGSSLGGFEGTVSPIYFDDKPLMVSVYVKVVNVKTVATTGYVRAGYETSWTKPVGTRYVGAWLGADIIKVGKSFEGRVYTALSKEKANSGATANFGGGALYIQGFTADQIIVSQPMITTGTITTEWDKAPEDQPEIDTSQFASATAVNKLTSDVTKIDGKVDAQATSIQQLDTKVGKNTASIQTQSQTINGIQANWTMKMDVNGYVSGIGAMNDGKSSEFIIRADRFAIANPTGTGKKYGFVYQSSPKTLPNGTVIPAGLYVDNLILGDIDARKINAESISAISANLGRFESNVAGKGKTVISGTEYQVFDANGVERIFLGVR